MLHINKFILFLLLFTTIQAKAQLTADFGIDPSSKSSGCAPLLVQFDNKSSGTITAYSWNLGNGDTSSKENPSTSYDSAGTYTVSLTVYDGTAKSTKTYTNLITVYPKPYTNFSALPLSACPGKTISFTDKSVLNATGTGSYIWEFGDVSSSSAQNPSHTYYTPGFYTVALQVTNSYGCDSSVSKTSYIHIYTPPAIMFSASNTHICNTPAVVNFSNSTYGTNPLTYKWSFGDGGTDTAQNPTHTYTSYSSFDVTLIATDSNGCRDTLTDKSYINVTHVTGSFTGPDSICAGDTAVFRNTTSGTGLSYTWLFGDGGTSTASNPGYVYTTDGYDTVSLIISDGHCKDTVRRPIRIHPLPVLKFSYSPAIPCPAPVAVTFTDRSVYGYTYLWNFGDGDTSHAQNPTHTYKADRADTITMTVTSQYGCVATHKFNDSAIIIQPLYNNIIPEDTGFCLPYKVSFSDYISTVPRNNRKLYPVEPIASHHWYFSDDGSTSTLATPTHNYNKYGTYYVIDTVTTGNGCIAVDIDSVHAGTLPTASFSGPSVVCADSFVQFYSTSKNATNYRWYEGDTTNLIGTDSDVVYKIKDTLSPDSIIFVAYNNGCPDTVIHTIKVNGPLAGFTPQFSCDTPLLLTCINQTVDATSLKWLFGDGDSSTAMNPMHIYATYGSYTDTLIAYNNTTGCRDTFIKPIAITAPMTPSFTASDTAVCQNAVIKITSSVVNGPAAQYIWYDNYGYRVIGNGMDVYYDTMYRPGYHTISLYITDSKGCVDSVVKYHYIIVGDPKAGFMLSRSSVCKPVTFTFTDTSSDVSGAYITKRFWDFGDGDTATDTSITEKYTYDTTGIFNVKLIVTDNIGCQDSITKTGADTIYEPSVAIGTYNNTPCAYQADQFYCTNLSPFDTLASYSWNFGDKTTSTNPFPYHTYTDTGTYTITLVVKDIHGCTDTAIAPALIHIGKPHASFTIDDSERICPTLIVNCTNTSTGATSYVWDMGNGTGGPSVDASASYNDSGKYTITLVAFDANGCPDTAIKHAYVFGYVGGITYSPLTGCSPLTVSFKSSITGAPTAIWDFSDGTTTADTSATITHTYTTPGTYVPKLVLGDGKGCESSSRGLDTIKVDGIVARYFPYPACEKDTVHFYDSSVSFFSPITAWNWTFNDSIHTTVQNPFLYYDTTGSYPVKFVVTNANGCKDSVDNDVTIYPPPNINAGPDTVICLGDAVTLYPSGGASYAWSPAATLSCANCANPSASPKVKTTYTVIGTDIHGCVNQDTLTIDLKTKSTGAIDSGGNICQGQSLQLNAYGAHQYVWIPATGLNNANIADPIASPDSTTKYMIIASEGSCIPDTIFATVVVNPVPSVSISAGNDNTIVAGQSVTLLASGSNIWSYKWSPVTALSCDTCSNPVATPAVTTTYQVKGYSQFGCVDSADVTIHVICDKSQVFIPNTFTPNGDGMNDIFYPRGTGIKNIKQFNIYNRWGELVFEKANFNINDEHSGWDGTYQGALPKPDVYVYILIATCESGEEITWKGDVTILR